MAVSKISPFPCKTLLVTNVGFDFDNAAFSKKHDIATLTSNVVTSSNIIAITGTCIGGAGNFSINSAKKHLYMALDSAYTGTLNANLIFYYS